jgi:hypothetical protein
MSLSITNMFMGKPYDEVNLLARVDAGRRAGIS